MEFKSQICTTKEQSERLLALGLKEETADMTIVKFGELYCEFVGEVEISCATIRMNGKEIDNNVKEHIPAWSLHRLVEIMFKGDIKGFVGYNIHANNVGIMYEYAISNIEALIKMGSFNKYYLEKKL